MLLSDYIGDVQEILHDTSASCWPVSRVISRINDARLDTARDMHCVRQIVTGVQLMPGVEIYGLSGAVAGANVTSGGSNYGTGLTVPITFDAPPPGGTRALGIGNLDGNGSLVSITMTQWGQRYKAVPSITIGGIGSGAAATSVPLFQSNPLSTSIGDPLQIVSISFTWNTRRASLSYLDFTLFQAYLRPWATNTFQGPPFAFSHVHQDRKLYIARPPDQTYLAEFDCVFMPAPLVANTDEDTQLVDPWARAVQFKAAAYLLLKHQNQGVARGMEAQYMEFVPRIITTSGGIRISNPYHRTFQRRVMAIGGY